MSKKIKLILAGTTEFSATVFQPLIENFDVLAIISQPDRPAKRGYKIQTTPTKELATQKDIKLFQHEKIGEIYSELSTLKFDFLITAAFGQYIPSKILKLAKKGSLNVHGSLLPKYRGAAPIQHALLNGDDTTGITFMYMAQEMDAGDMLAQVKYKIQENDNSEDLFKILATLAAKNIVQWVNDLYENKLQPEKQNFNSVTYSPKITKEMAEFFLIDNAEIALRKIRALSHNPGAFIILNNKRLKVYRASLKPIKNAVILEMNDQKLYCYEYQYEGKKRVLINNK
ncbi:methionyl-tRNA formyltransferase [Candidatus Mycoplasma pogonae]